MIVDKIAGLFGKKKKKAFDYRAVVFVPSVDSMQQQTAVEVELKRDKEDNLLYLQDIKTNGKFFKEIFPGENKEIFVADELTNLEKKLKTLETKRKSKDTKSVNNPLNIEKEYKKLKRLIIKLKEPKGTFAFQNSKGEKLIYYLRKSSGLEPLHFDIHTNEAYSPTEAQSKDVFNIWKVKYENLKDKPQTSFEKITATITAVVLILLCLGNGVLFWNLYEREAEWDQMKIEQKYICDIAAQQTISSIYSINKNTSLTLNQYALDTFGVKSPALEKPNVETIK